MRCLIPALALAAACSTETDDTPVDSGGDGPTTQEVTIPVAATIGGQSVDCRKQFPDVGATRGEAKFTDLPIYVHDLKAVMPGGTTEALVLPDTAWQDDGLVLLDFENGADFCDAGTPETNTAITATAPTDMVGLQLTLGVPFERNHTAPSEATPALLAEPALFRNATVGYIFFKLGLETQVQGGDWPVWINSICTVDDGGVSCAAENLVTFTLPAFDPTSDTLTFAIDTLLDTVDLTQNASVTTPGGVTKETPPGCQTDPTDPDCQAIFQTYGLGAATPTWISAGE